VVQSCLRNKAAGRWFIGAAIPALAKWAKACSVYTWKKVRNDAVAEAAVRGMTCVTAANVIEMKRGGSWRRARGTLGVRCAPRRWDDASDDHWNRWSASIRLFPLAMPSLRLQTSTRLGPSPWSGEKISGMKPARYEKKKGLDGRFRVRINFVYTTPAVIYSPNSYTNILRLLPFKIFKFDCSKWWPEAYGWLSE